jgi:hypothetical protein
MGVVALVVWIVTVSFGLTLLGNWMARGGLTRQGGRPGWGPGVPPPYFPAPLIALHAMLATGGLVVFTLYLMMDANSLAWLALFMLMPVDILGLSMFTRWLGSRRTRRLATVPGVVTPAESRLPLALVICHGMLASATFVLVFLTALGVGGS